MIKPISKKVVLITSLVTFLCIASVILFDFLVGEQLVESIYKGESIEFLNQLFETHKIKILELNREIPSLEYYLLRRQGILFRIILLLATPQLIIYLIYFRHEIFRGIRNFFAAESNPINLAIFRVVLFWTLLSSFSISYTSNFAQIPAELRFLPSGLGWIFDYLPINETLVKVLGTLFVASCFAGMIGIFTRTSALLTLILGFYLLGIPQLFGKVNHYHHLLWFVAILAVSRCGDVLSVDAILRAWKRADKGIVDPPRASRIYALPLRFVWLLMGVIYFFPGFWKLWRSAGLAWALSDNLKFHLYSRWHILGGWTPIFRLDQYPFLYKSSALGSIIFEVSFIFLIFSPRLRIFAAVGGLVFHNMTDFFMRISFRVLQNCYVALFNWHAIFNFLGRYIYRREMYLIYDGNCQLCRRTIASIRVFDIFGRVTYVNALDEEALANHDLLWLDSNALLRDMHVVVQRKRWIGFSAYRVLASRIFILWPILPFLYVWPIPKVGNRIYRYVADRRTCSINKAPLKSGEYQYSRRYSSRAVVTVGILLFLVNVFYGIRGEGGAWPFACYPTFAGIKGPTRSSIEIAALNSAGDIIPFDESLLREKMSPERYAGLVGRILGEKPVQQSTRLKAFWEFWSQNNLNLQQADSIQIYKVTWSTIPDRQKEEPVDRELMLELKL